MREIKFRAWDIGEKNWISPQNVKVYTDAKDKVLKFIVNGIATKGIVFMQYTGHKDKKGKEIYEGDIVKYGKWTDKGVTKPVLYIIEWKGYGWGWKQVIPVLTEEFELKQTEIIGNIYENPEFALVGEKEQ